MTHLFVFHCEGKTDQGHYFVIEQEFIHDTELEARREVIFNLNNMYQYYPKKLTLLRKEKWEKPIWDLS